MIVTFIGESESNKRTATDYLVNKKWIEVGHTVPELDTVCTTFFDAYDKVCSDHKHLMPNSLATICGIELLRVILPKKAPTVQADFNIKYIEYQREFINKLLAEGKSVVTQILMPNAVQINIDDGEFYTKIDNTIAAHLKLKNGSIQMKVAFNGEIGSGKSTATAYLVSKNWAKASYAGPLKKAVAEIFDIEEKYLHDQELKAAVHPELGCTPRKLLQIVGTELFREALHKHIPELKLGDARTIWIRKHRRAVNALFATGKSVATEDLRFPDESFECKHDGTLRIRIVRPSETKSTPTHSSEMGCEVDVTIYNSGTLEELYQKIDEVLETYHAFGRKTDTLKEGELALGYSPDTSDEPYNAGYFNISAVSPVLKTYSFVVPAAEYDANLKKVRDGMAAISYSK